MKNFLTVIRRAQVFLNLTCIIVCLITLIPFILTIFLSFKDNPQFFHYRWSLTFPLHLENYVIALKSIYRYLLNTVYIALSSTLILVLVILPPAYIFSLYEFPGKRICFNIFILLMMIPGILSLVPSFLLMKYFGLINTRWALFFPYVTGGIPMSILILRTYFSSISKELYESARVDGASDLYILGKIYIPISKSVVSLIVIMRLLAIWNDFLWPLVVLQEDSLRTVAVGLYYFQAQFAVFQRWGPMFAGYLLASLPLILLFIFANKLFIEGVMSGAIKM